MDAPPVQRSFASCEDAPAKPTGCAIRLQETHLQHAREQGDLEMAQGAEGRLDRARARLAAVTDG